jgi:hypothetical protein
MRIGRYLLVAGTILIAAVVLPYAYEFFVVDDCLNLGGSYDYSRGACDHEENHPYNPYTRRHPAAKPTAEAGAALALCGLLLLLLGSVRRKRAA